MVSQPYCSEYDQREGLAELKVGLRQTHNTDDFSHSDSQPEAGNQGTQCQKLDNAMNEGGSKDAHEYSS